jgi:hypothetical protein
MIRSFFIIPLLYRLNTFLYEYKPFVFPEGCRPNISDPSTFETNYTVSDTDIEAALNYALANDSIWEEEVIFDNLKKMKTTHWEDMMRFGLGEA